MGYGGEDAGLILSVLMTGSVKPFSFVQAHYTRAGVGWASGGVC